MLGTVTCQNICQPLAPSRRTGVDGSPTYLVNNLPWDKITHLNYAFATVDAATSKIASSAPAKSEAPAAAPAAAAAPSSTTKGD